VLGKLATSCGLTPLDVEAALADVRAALGTA